MVLAFLSLLHLSYTSTPAATTSPLSNLCNYNAGVQWTRLPLGVHVTPCSAAAPIDPYQQWEGDTLTSLDKEVASPVRNAGTGAAYCLGTSQEDPVTMSTCNTDGSVADGVNFMYNHTARTLGVANNTEKCFNINHDTGPDVNFNRCPRAITPPHVRARRQFDWMPSTRQLRSVYEPTLCLTLNRSKILTYVEPPCIWPSIPPSTSTALPWNRQSNLLKGIALLENVTAIPGYNADTWYPAEDRYGKLYSGFDDGVVGAIGGAIYEEGYPMNGRYTSANLVVNGTIWVGTYGLNASNGTCPLGLCQEVGPFVGFRTSIDGGNTWAEPKAANGENLTVANPLFEILGEPVKFGAPHVVDHGPENVHSPDGSVTTKAGKYAANNPASLNNPANWEFYCGKLCWTSNVAKAMPIFSWKGRVGTVTATWHGELQRYLIVVTTPTFMPSTVGPYDTYVLETPSLADGPFSLVSYMPRFGQQAYFVSLPSMFFGPPGSKKAVLTFSANFMCKTGGCEPNIWGATYGANLLPIRFG
eukprot:gene16197-20681_t